MEFTIILAPNISFICKIYFICIFCIYIRKKVDTLDLISDNLTHPKWHFTSQGFFIEVNTVQDTA